LEFLLFRFLASCQYASNQIVSKAKRKENNAFSWNVLINNEENKTNPTTKPLNNENQDLESARYAWTKQQENKKIILHLLLI
jgi:hypothetical protein